MTSHDGKTVAGTDATFDRLVVDSDVPVLVDFWAPWCAPCRAVAPVLEEIAAQYAGKLTVVKVDTDQHGVVAAQHNITSIPTLQLWRDGEVVDVLIGARPKKVILEHVEAVLAG